MSENVKVTSSGIKKLLKNHDQNQAIAEYIWNGFDAKASAVAITYEKDFGELGAITQLSISDTGEGISYAELNSKFEPFFQSDKAVEISNPKNQSACHGKNGVGRLTFFRFAKKATWNTTVSGDDELLSYQIQIDSDLLNSFDPAVPEPASTEETGTMVTFSGIHDLSAEVFEKDVVPFLCLEFGWFLELNRDRQFSITINGEELNYSHLIEASEDESFLYKESGVQFDVRFVRWAQKLNHEYSKYYYCGSDGFERWKENTTFNNKGDNFFHSVYVNSCYFNAFFGDARKKVSEGHGELFASKKDNEFKFLAAALSEYLNEKRVPFVRGYTEKLVQQYEEEEVFPEFDSSVLGKYRKHQLEETVKELYLVQPKIFTSLNVPQKKAFLELLNAMLELGADDKLLEIISKIVEMTPEQRNEFAHILEFADMSAITKTIGMIKDRFKTIEQLKKLVFDSNLKANERDHLQKLVEKHFWIFGEQYNLVTAEEPKFEEALRRFTTLLQVDGVVRKIDHVDKNREMDIFACRKDVRNDVIENVVAELKHPDIKLGKKELNQVDTYLGVILKQPEFNAANMQWTFFLIGKDFDGSGTIERAYENAKGHGEMFIVQKALNYKVYVKKWSEIFTEFECRHNFLLEKLKLDKELLLKDVEEQQAAAEIVEDAQANEAVETASWDKPRESIGEADKARGQREKNSDKV